MKKHGFFIYPPLIPYPFFLILNILPSVLIFFLASILPYLAALII